VGKQLALSEARLVVARTVERFVVDLGEGYDDEVWKRGWKDFQTLSLAPLNMRFEKRGE
jgi:hypothetical protein